MTTATRESISNLRVLLFGGNGRVARAMTSLMVARSWDVTSVIRNPQQELDILRLGAHGPGRLDVLHCDLRHIESPDDATRLLEKVQPNCVVFAAGSFSNPYEIDRDVAQRIIQASGRADYRDIKEYLWESNSYPSVKDSKLQADEHLVAVARQRELRGSPGLQAISLRPSWLLTSPATGKVKLGKTQAVGQVTIGDVASVAVSLLSRDDTSGWYDLVQGDQGIDQAVEAVVRDRVICIEGEDVQRIYSLKLD
ncbi:uncharacterized protein CDV56_100036 [Aspergillus thermomutatus]|uniref:NAD(P)-binding domain-containing protein n=1 Tax=Aspergillus thermomutatus TaxID=41047 RepID=A0A397G0I0_ASPTH|nr:uncharacterized protein CDV56_100036 [Aspergillus thermomutatus]RHZ43324.1 hypothetical protein CDV56_100036 [Aspergillus thermomutatus]